MNSSEANLKLPVGNARLVKKSDRDMFEDTTVVGADETLNKIASETVCNNQPEHDLEHPNVPVSCSDLGNKTVATRRTEEKLVKSGQIYVEEVLDKLIAHVMTSSKANLKLPVGNARLFNKSDRDMFEDTTVVGANETIIKVSEVISNNKTKQNLEHPTLTPFSSSPNNIQKKYSDSDPKPSGKTIVKSGQNDVEEVEKVKGNVDKKSVASSEPREHTSMKSGCDYSLRPCLSGMDWADCSWADPDDAL